MIPFRDVLPSERIPFVNYALIALCSLGFLAELGDATRMEALFAEYALVPSRFFEVGYSRGFLDSGALVPLIASTFLHANLLHFGGNMLFLWIFGDNVEDRFGHLGYAIFYLAGGIAAGITHAITSPESMVPTVGASGAIAGVMGAYMIMYPRARIESLLILIFYVRVISVPAGIYLLLWFGLQLFHGIGSIGATGGGIAWWAHAGGFIFGISTVLLLGIRLPGRRR